MTRDEYRAYQAINATAIKAGRLSMAHMHAVMTGGGKADTEALRKGRRMHSAVLEPLTIAEYAIWDGARKQGKVWEAFQADNDGKDIITAAEYEELRAISDAFRASHASGLIAGCAFERPLVWSDGCMECKALVDACRRGMLIEYKTTARIQTRAFMAQCESLGYLMQLGWYARGLCVADGLTGWPACYLIAQESAAPYSVAVYEVKAHQLEQGYNEALKIALHYHACCITGGPWPGPYDGQVLQYERPAWAGGDGETDISDGTMEASEL